MNQKMCMIIRQSEPTPASVMDCATHTKARFTGKSTEKQPCDLNCDSPNPTENN